MKYFFLMIRFFTRIPIKINNLSEEKDFAKGLPYFPFVGLVIGVFNFLAFYFFSFFGDLLLSVMFWIFANILITGALHIDGLADTCDGLLSYKDKETMLKIMKDSRIGTNGVIAIFMDILLRLSLMLALSPGIRPYAILISPILGKTVLLILIWVTPYARKDGGIGGLFYKDISKKYMMVGMLSGILMIFFIYSWRLYLVLALCFIKIFLFRRFAISKIGGMTGDTLGAANEITELSFLLFIFFFERVGLF